LIAEAFTNEERHAVAIPHPVRKRRWGALNKLLDINKKAKITTDEEGQTGSQLDIVAYHGMMICNNISMKWSRL
jgi:hypothetical protein